MAAPALSERARDLLRKEVSDREFTREERLAMAEDLIVGVLDELATTRHAAHCVAEGKLEVARDAVASAKDLLS